MGRVLESVAPVCVWGYVLVCPRARLRRLDLAWRTPAARWLHPPQSCAQSKHADAGNPHRTRTRYPSLPAGELEAVAGVINIRQSADDDETHAMLREEGEDYKKMRAFKAVCWAGLIGLLAYGVPRGASLWSRTCISRALLQGTI